MTEYVYYMTSSPMLTCDEIKESNAVGSPILLDHNPNQRIGTITKVEIIDDTHVRITWKKDS